MSRARAVLAASALLALAGCAVQVSTAVEPGAPGFFAGLWHGFIFPVAWFLSLLSSKIAVYAVPNNGGWYDFGYFLGICVFGVGARSGGKATKIVYRDRIVRDRGTRIIDQ